MKTIKVMLDEGAYMPQKAYGDDAGFDLRTPMKFTIPPWSHKTVLTGVHMLIPSGYCGKVSPKSGLSSTLGLDTDGVIDARYTGSIGVTLYNNSDSYIDFVKGQKIAQLVIQEVPQFALQMVDTLPETERGSNGFGSTGK